MIGASEFLIILAGMIPALALWIAVIIFAAVRLRRGGGRAERFLLAGASLKILDHAVIADGADRAQTLSLFQRGRQLQAPVAVLVSDSSAKVMGSGMGEWTGPVLKNPTGPATMPGAAPHPPTPTGVEATHSTSCETWLLLKPNVTVAAGSRTVPAGLDQLITPRVGLSHPGLITRCGVFCPVVHIALVQPRTACGAQRKR